MGPRAGHVQRRGLTITLPITSIERGERQENHNDEIPPFRQSRSTDAFQDVSEGDSKACSISHPLLFGNPKVIAQIAGFEPGTGSRVKGRQGIEPNIAQPDSLHRPFSPPG
jgi:hypothetical protein